MSMRSASTWASGPAPNPRVGPTSVREALATALLVSGIASTAYYAGVNVYVPIRFEGYSMLSRVVSELSAIGAPTRALWVALLVPYTVLLIAFGVGVWLSAGPSRALRVVGILFVVNAVVGLFWPPMHQRGVAMSLTDILHIAWSLVWLAVMVTAMVLSAKALGGRFRIYTFVTLAVFVVFGTLTSIDGAKLAQDLPTPWIGLWERINIGAGMLWIAVLAGALLRRPAERAP